jgi:hypothetical protein
MSKWKVYKGQHDMKTYSMNSDADFNEQDILLIHWYTAPEACGAQCLLSMFRMHNFK